jgi:hypothetical protein
MHKLKQRSVDQSGFASVVIALTMVIVISLLTIGFAQLARREQQNSLNSQLSRQAFYAAETGINDVITLVKAGIISDTGNACFSGFPITYAGKTYTGTGSTGTVSSASGVTYSCVTVSTKNYALEKKPVAQDTAWNTIFSTNPAAAPLSSLDIRWESTTAGKVLRAVNSGFTPTTGASAWNSPAVLQVSITPLVNTSRNSLIDNTFTTYLYPSLAGGPPSVAYNKTAGVTIVSSCTGSPYTCKATIRCLEIASTAAGGVCGSGGTSGASYLVHILPYYDTSNIYIENAKSLIGGSLTLNGAQAVIDVTGAARQVLKRLQVHVDLGNFADMPNYGIEAQDICKRIKTDPATTNFIGVNDNVSDAGALNGPSCILSP